MPIPATVREQRLRTTKSQLIDEIDTLERRAAPSNVKALIETWAWEANQDEA